jgi:hypothetical protein
MSSDGGLSDAELDLGVCTSTSEADSSQGVCEADEPLPMGLKFPVVTPWITIVIQPVVLVKKPYMNPKRRRVVMGVDDTSFDGTGTFTFTPGPIRFYTKETGGSLIASGKVYPGAELDQTVTVWAEGAHPSAKMEDVELVLTLKPGSKPVNPPARTRMTSVEVTLDIHKTRTAVGTDGVALTVAEKTSNPGRIVHKQDGGFHHGRALLVVHRALPKEFPGILILTPDKGSVKLYDTANEVGPGASFATFTIPNPSITAPAAAPVKRLWVEGVAISGGLGDTGYRLGVAGVDTEGDRVKMTSMQFSDLRAVVPSTPPAHTQGGNGPVADHAPFGGGAGPVNYDESFTVNHPLVLIEGSLPATRKVSLSVTIQPHVPVFWGVERNKFGANADHPSIQKLTGDPTIAPQGTNTLTATIQLNAVGSFWIRPFVDIDGGGANEFHDATGARIDREPFIIMTLVLVRAQGFANQSKRLNPAPALTPIVGAAPITAFTGVAVSTSSIPPAPGCNWTGPTSAAWNKARMTLIGGGPQGRWGVDSAAPVPQRVFAGWSQCIEHSNIFRDYLDLTSVPPKHHIERYIFTTNPPVPLGRGVFCAVGTGPAAAPYTSTNAAPALAKLPVLDVSPFAPNVGTGGNTCVGTECASGPGPPIPPGLATTNLQAGIATVNLPTAGNALAYGQDWTVEQWDAPGMGAIPSAILFAGNLVEFRFDLDFRTDLVVWTNVTGVPGATNDAANRLYASVQTNRWTVRFRVTFDPPGSATAGTARVKTALVFRMAKDANPTRRAHSLQGRPATEGREEQRFPIALNCYSIDATT